MVIHVSTIPQRVQCAEGGCHAAGSGQRITPSIVGVSNDLGSGSVDNASDIALRVAGVVVGCAVEDQRSRADGVVDEGHLVVVPRHFHQLVAQIAVVICRTIQRLGGTQTIGVIRIGCRGIGRGCGHQPPSVIPRISPCAVAEQITNGVIGQRVARFLTSRERGYLSRVMGAEKKDNPHSMLLGNRELSTNYFSCHNANITPVSF